jgi:hypothetical protein
MHGALGVQVEDVFHHVLELSYSHSARYALAAGLRMAKPEK